jgi:hypothetical protein
MEYFKRDYAAPSGGDLAFDLCVDVNTRPKALSNRCSSTFGIHPELAIAFVVRVRRPPEDAVRAHGSTPTTTPPERRRVTHRVRC